MKKKVLRTLAVCMAIVFCALSVCAEVELYAEGTAHTQGSIDATVLLSGQSVTGNALIKGILFAAGYDVNAGGSSEYTFAAGYNVAVGGNVENDAFLAGYTVSIPGSVARDVCAAGHSVSVSGNIGRDLNVSAGSVNISGTVMGDVYIDADTIVIAENALIGGTLQYNGDAVINAPAKVLSSAIVYGDSEPEEDIEEDLEDSADIGETVSMVLVVGKVLSTVSSYVGLVLVAFLLLWLTPLWKTVDKRYEGAAFGKYAAAFGIGLAALICTPIVTLLLLISGVGARLALLLVFAYAAACTVASAVFAWVLGELFWRKALHKNVCYPAELAIGLAFWKLLALIPGLSFVVGLVAIPFGFGSLVLLLENRKPAPKAFPTEPSEPTEPTNPAA